MHALSGRARSFWVDCLVSPAVHLDAVSSSQQASTWRVQSCRALQITTVSLPDSPLALIQPNCSFLLRGRVPTGHTPTGQLTADLLRPGIPPAPAHRLLHPPGHHLCVGGLHADAPGRPEGRHPRHLAGTQQASWCTVPADRERPSAVCSAAVLIQTLHCTNELAADSCAPAISLSACQSTVRQAFM